MLLLQSRAEQNEVEQWLVRGTWLLPPFHQTYWIGYSTYNSWPNFKPIDGTVKMGYTNWGTFQVCCHWLQLRSIPLRPQHGGWTFAAKGRAKLQLGSPHGPAGS